MWSEEELRDIPDPPRPLTRSQAPAIRQDILTRNHTRAQSYPHELTRTASVIYSPTPTTHGNFIDASYRRILANPAWRNRLNKAHTSRRQPRLTSERPDPWCELDAATSSDALLMNIFCYPRILATASLPAFLGIDRRIKPIFGFKPRIPLHRNLVDTTEIDLKLGPLLIEAKLTELNFSSAPFRKLNRYRALSDVFSLELINPSLLPTDSIPSYQLIRGILAAHTHTGIFCLLCDARRPDLIDSWYTIIRAVRPYDLRTRLRVLTWQDISPYLPGPLATFIHEKYGI